VHLKYAKLGKLVRATRGGSDEAAS
jgi:hypothetical protein